MMNTQTKVKAQRVALFLMLALAVFASLGFSILSGGARERRQTQKSKADAQRYVHLVEIARENDGLHKAAIANNGYYLSSDDGLPFNRAASLEDLLHGATEVFVGTVQDSNSELEHRGTYIHTRYSVQVERVLKGDLQPGQIVSFILPGGKVTFDDGTAAEVDKVKEPRLLREHRYTLFAAQSNQENGLRPAGADQAVFELLSNGSVHPHAYYPWDSLQSVGQLKHQEFLTKLQTAVEKEKS